MPPVNLPELASVAFTKRSGFPPSLTVILSIPVTQPRPLPTIGPRSNSWMRRPQTELAARAEVNSHRRIRAARFPFHKPLDEFDFAFQPSVNERQIRDLATMRFAAHAENILFLSRQE